MSSSTKWLGAAVIVLILIGAYFYVVHPAPLPGAAASYKDDTYLIDGSPVTLAGGVSQTPAAAGSASMVTTRYFGNEAWGDFNGDGTVDVSFILTQNSGGSGTFYYVAVALKNADGSYSGTNAVLLGDRIAPQSSEVQNGEIVVNYADRAPGEPMSATPSVAVSKYFSFQNGQLVEVSAQ